MATEQYRRTKGQRSVYTIGYEQGEYFIQRDGLMKKSVADSVVVGIAPNEATPAMMRKMAISDIESLIGMEE